MTKGTIKYIPKELLEELNSMKIQLDIDNNADCFREIVKNNRVGKEIKFNLNIYKIGSKRKNDKR